MLKMITYNPHEKQAKAYENMQVGRAVGFIKFTKYPDELKNGEIFLSKESSFNNSKPPIGDQFEGFLLDDKPITSYKDILNLYCSNSEAYISCFTALFESDFDNKTGRIKKDVADRLVQLDKNNEIKRSAVIFNFKKVLECFNTAKPEKLNSLYGPATIKGSYIHYTDDQVFLNQEDKEKLSNWKNHNNSCFPLYEYSLLRCIFSKEYKYNNQREYKFMETIFNEKNKKPIPKSLKLKFSSNGWGTKVFPNSKIKDIKLEHFLKKNIPQVKQSELLDEIINFD